MLSKILDNEMIGGQMMIMKSKIPTLYPLKLKLTLYQWIKKP